MKGKNFKEQTLFNFYKEVEKDKFVFEDSLLVKGLLFFGEGEIISLPNRDFCSPRKYRVQGKNTELTCFDLYDDNFKKFALPTKNIIQRNYNLYPLD